MAAATTTLDETAPDPAWVTGTCPKCGAPCGEMNVYTRDVHGRITGVYRAVECWNSLGSAATCDYTSWIGNRASQVHTRQQAEVEIAEAMVAEFQTLADAVSHAKREAA